MNDPQCSQTSNPPRALAVRAPLPDEDDLFLGWECANPALQIERWFQDTQLRPLESC